MPASRARSGGRLGDVLGRRRAPRPRGSAGPAPPRPATRCGRTESTCECRAGLAGEVDGDIERLACGLAAVGCDQDGLHWILLSLSPDSGPGVPRTASARAWRVAIGERRADVAAAFPNAAVLRLSRRQRACRHRWRAAETGTVVRCGAGAPDRRPATSHYEGNLMRRWLQYGGFAAGVVLIVFGVVAIAMGANGRSTVRDNLRAGADRRLARHDARGHQGRGGQGRRPQRASRSRPAAWPA